MSSFAHLQRCLQVGEREIAAAVRAREVCKDLLDRIAAIAKPRDGAPKILLLFGRLATEECTWMEGDLRVEMAEEGETSVLTMMAELGPGVRERIFPAFTLKVPLRELIGAIEKAPGLITPLCVGSSAGGRMILVVLDAPLDSVPPPNTQIDVGSLFPPALEEK